MQTKVKIEQKRKIISLEEYRDLKNNTHTRQRYTSKIDLLEMAMIITYIIGILTLLSK